VLDPEFKPQHCKHNKEQQKNLCQSALAATESGLTQCMCGPFKEVTMAPKGLSPSRQVGISDTCEIQLWTGVFWVRSDYSEVRWQFKLCLGFFYSKAKRRRLGGCSSWLQTGEGRQWRLPALLRPCPWEIHKMCVMCCEEQEMMSDSSKKKVFFGWWDPSGDWLCQWGVSWEIFPWTQ
jgi:hypothetical protein